MKKLLLAIILCAGFASLAFGQSNPPLRLQEIDGSPNVLGVTTIKVTNGTLSCSGKVCTITISGGGGGSPGGSNTQLQYNNVGAFGGITGATTNGTFVTLTSPVFVTPALGTPASGVATNITGLPISTGLTGAGTGVLTALGINVGSAGAFVTFNGALGTPSSGTATNITGLPISTGVSGLGTGVATWLATPSSANLIAALTDETGTGVAVFGTSPTLTTPTISGAISFPDDVRQTFNPGTTNAGLNVGALAGDPSTPSNGDLWYDSTANELTARINGANVALGSGGGGGITIGTTTITSGTNTRVLFDNAGVVGQYAITGTGNVAMSTSPTFTGTLTAGLGAFAGAARSSGTAAYFTVTAPADTGLTASTEAIGISFVGATREHATGALTLQREYVFAAPTYSFAGVSTLTNAATVAITSPVAGTNATITNPYALLLTGAGATGKGAMRVNAASGNSFTQINDNGTVVIDADVATGTTPLTVKYNGSTMVTVGFTGEVVAVKLNAGAGIFTADASNVNIASNTVPLRFGASSDLILRRSAAANLAFGAADAASPVAQTMSVQNVVAGTSNTAGANWTHNASIGTGTGVGGDYIIQTAPAGSTGTAQNSLAAAFTVKGNGAVQLKSVTFTNLPTVANGYLIYCSDCTIASPCASGGTGALAKGINSAWVCN